MSTIPAFDSGLSSIQRGMNGLKKNASEIANIGSNAVASNNPAQVPEANNITQPLINMKTNKFQIEMGAKAIQTGSNMIGSLLDIKA